MGIEGEGDVLTCGITVNETFLASSASILSFQEKHVSGSDNRPEKRDWCGEAADISERALTRVWTRGGRVIRPTNPFAVGAIHVAASLMVVRFQRSARAPLILASEASSRDKGVAEAMSMEDRHIERIERCKRLIRRGEYALGTQEELSMVKARMGTDDERAADRDRLVRLEGLVRAGKCKRGDSKETRLLKDHVRRLVKRDGDAVSEKKVRWLCESADSPLFHLNIDYAVEYHGWERTPEDERALMERFDWEIKIALNRWRQEHCAFYLFAPTALTMDLEALTAGELKKCVGVILRNFGGEEEARDIDRWKDLQVLKEMVKGRGTKSELAAMVDRYRILLFMRDPELCHEFGVDPMFCDIMLAVPRALTFLLKYVPRDAEADEVRSSDEEEDLPRVTEIENTEERTNVDQTFPTEGPPATREGGLQDSSEIAATAKFTTQTDIDEAPASLPSNRDSIGPINKRPRPDDDADTKKRPRREEESAACSQGKWHGPATSSGRCDHCADSRKKASPHHSNADPNCHVCQQKSHSIVKSKPTTESKPTCVRISSHIMDRPFGTCSHCYRVRKYQKSSLQEWRCPQNCLVENCKNKN